jgi:hypothetical protein
MRPVSRSRARRTLALAAAVALGCASAADATTYFTATSSAGSSISMSNLLFTSFDNGFYDVRFAGACTSCITATSGTGSALGTFDFSMNGLPWSYIQDPVLYPDNGTRAYSGGSEVFGGYGGVGITKGAANLFSGDFDFATIFATPGDSTATAQFEFEQPNIQSNVFDLTHVGPLYLIITGATAAPVSLTDLVAYGGTTLQTLSAPMTIDYTVTLTDTPYTPETDGGGTPGGVPEPGTWLLMLLGAGGMGLALRRRRPIVRGEPCPSL